VIWLAGGAIFASLFILGYFAFGARRVSKTRLGIEKQPRDLNHSMNNLLGEERFRRFAQSLNLASISTPPGTLVIRVLLISAVAAILGLLVSPVLALVLLVVPFIALRSWVSYKVRKRREQFADQLADTLQLLIAAMRSGYGLTQAMTIIVEETEEPISSEIDRVLAEVRMGRDMSEAMQAMAQRMDNTDLEWVIGAIDINRETGGNLSEILENVNTTIRDRRRIQGKIRTYTAEGRLSARVLSLLPVGFLLLMWNMNPEGVSHLFYGPGLAALLGGLVLMGFGWLWIRKIISIKF
jgi:tight adherence protein B